MRIAAILVLVVLFSMVSCGPDLEEANKKRMEFEMLKMQVTRFCDALDRPARQEQEEYERQSAKDCAAEYSKFEKDAEAQKVKKKYPSWVSIKCDMMRPMKLDNKTEVYKDCVDIFSKVFRNRIESW